MKLVVLVSLFIQLLIAARAQNRCAHNEFCVHPSICPDFRDYAGRDFSTWPRKVQLSARRNRCDSSRQQTVSSVCCPSAMNSPTCGTQITVDKIAFGQVAQPFEFPWMVLLRASNGKFVCGGTLISRIFVLTAAHCVKNANMYTMVQSIFVQKISTLELRLPPDDNRQSVRLGENDISQKKDCIIPEEQRDCAPPPQDIRVQRIISHGNYSARHKKNDIALLRLKWPATLGDSVRTICLPNQAFHPSKLYVAGWGLTEMNESFDVLRYARVPLVPREKCAPRVQHLGTHLRLDDSQVCAGGVDKVDNCSGDSGGPLKYFNTKTSKYVQYGVVSYGLKSCGVKSEPGVYTKVEHYIGWILQHVNE